MNPQVCCDNQATRLTYILFATSDLAAVELDFRLQNIVVKIHCIFTTMFYNLRMLLRTLQKQIQKSLKNKKSVLLIGPRQVGKSTLLKGLRPNVEFNLARQSTFLEFIKNPDYLEQNLAAILPKGGLVSVDEIQRVPSLLNTIQYLIDEKRPYQFIMTGSSARKLRRGRANLLPGRVHSYDLGPITSCELNYDANTDFMLSFGSLPAVITDTDTKEIKKLLRSYSVTYLSEEIKAEALTKNIEGFTRFLFKIAVESSHYLDLSKISKNVGVPRQTIQRYFEILEDTLLVHRLESFAKSEKRRLIQHPRFYFFDNGVLNALLGNFNCSDDRKGQLFENLFVTQLLTALRASEMDFRISNYRTDAGAEVDVILELEGKTYAIEIKTGGFSKADLGGLNSFEKFISKKIQKFVVLPDGNPRRIDDVQILPWQDFMKQLKI